MKHEKTYIYGRHALMEALLNAPQVVKKVHLSPDNRDKELRDLIAKKQIPTAELKQGQGSEIVGRDAPHQGVIALMDPEKLLRDFETFVETVDRQSNSALVILGEVQDPHNVGAVIRSAAAFGLSGVLIPEHKQAQITGAVVKASSGMAFRIPLVRIGNVNHAVRALKEKRFWVYGLSMEGEKTLREEPFDGPAVFIVGNEGAGIREKTLELCDITLRVPMHARTESLNAAVSAGIVFYEWSTKNAAALVSKS